ncbi:Uncharacterized protein Rs2_48608 [Raphanus sativus]|nr:Uncharacterized protein Rs2_48608 [Raphanus sativus]
MCISSASSRLSLMSASLRDTIEVQAWNYNGREELGSQLCPLNPSNARVGGTVRVQGSEFWHMPKVLRLKAEDRLQSKGELRFEKHNRTRRNLVILCNCSHCA